MPDANCPQTAWAMPLSGDMRFLLACCHAQVDTARLAQAASQVKDWAAVAQLARHHLMVPMVRARLQTLPPCTQRAPAMDTLADLHRNITRRTLLQIAELQHLVSHHLEPQGIRYVAIKGLTLAACYYGDAMLRQGRDIDLLIDPSRLYELVVDLIKHGYKLKAQAEIHNDADLRAFCAMEYEVGLFSPRGVLIELHRQLDATGSQYPASPVQLFEMARPVTLRDRPYEALPTNELFIYICYHHSQHQWSRLHWMADLDALLTHPSFDRETLLDRARSLGMEPLVLAVLDLHAVMLGGRALDTVHSPFARRLIADCLHYLCESSVAPEDVRRTLSTSPLGMLKVRNKIFLYNWRANTRWRNRLRYVAALTHGSYADYRFLPLPAQLQGLYGLLRPIRWLAEAMPSRKAHRTNSI